MSESQPETVRRYKQFPRDEHCFGVLLRNVEGEWVRFTDYQQLQEERDAFRDEANAVRRNLSAERSYLAARADEAERRLAEVRNYTEKLKGMRGSVLVSSVRYLLDSILSSPEPQEQP